MLTIKHFQQMESFRILTLLWFISCFSLGNISAQASRKMRYNLSDENTTKSLCAWDTSFSQKNGSRLFRVTGLTLPWYDITEIPNSVFLYPNRDYKELLKTSILFSDNGIRLTGKSPSMTSSGSSGTFNAKWERLTGKSIIDTSRVYYSPMKRTNNPTISDNQFYRTGANMFNMFVSAKYPYLNRSK
jgi:hypothetical protein